MWEISTGKEVIRMKHDNKVNSVAFSPDGKYVVSGSGDRTVRVWEVATGQEIAQMAHDNYVNSVAFSPNGQYIVSGGADNAARMWEVATGQEITRVTHGGWVNSVAFSPDGQFVVSAGEDKLVRVWKWNHDWFAEVCPLMTRNLNPVEWRQYIGAVLPYQAVCPNLPLEPQVTSP